jgi:nucleotide-binding universal stress UspA family protein
MVPEIVLATRFGPSSAEPARVASELARRIGARITVLYVASELQALQVGGAEAGIDPVIVEGDVADQVAGVARDVNATYIVVGTRGRGQLARLILGDTTQNILQRTPCPVLVVPLRDTGEPSG